MRVPDVPPEMLDRKTFETLCLHNAATELMVYLYHFVEEFLAVSDEYMMILSATGNMMLIAPFRSL